MHQLAKAALIVIDVQKGFNEESYWGIRNNPDAELNMLRLMSFWRKAKLPLVHIKHMSGEAASPLRPGQIGNEFKLEFYPQENEVVFEKEVNSAFIGTDLESYLHSCFLDTVVIIGLSTDHCISTTTRMAGNLGFNTYVVADATATFNRKTYDGKNIDASLVHEIALASLHSEFATVIETEKLLEIIGKNLMSFM